MDIKRNRQVDMWVRACVCVCVASRRIQYTYANADMYKVGHRASL